MLQEQTIQHNSNPQQKTQSNELHHAQPKDQDIEGIQPVQTVPNFKNKPKCQSKCPVHPDTNLSLLNVQAMELECPKCVIYSEEREKYQHATFVEIDQKNNTIDHVLRRFLDQVDGKIKMEKQGICYKVKQQKQMAYKSAVNKVDAKYRQLLQQLNSSRMRQQQKIVSKLQKIWNNLWKQSLQQLSTLQQKSHQLNSHQHLNQCIQIQSELQSHKLRKISSAISLSKTLDNLSKGLEVQAQLAVSGLRKFTKQYKCGLKMGQSTIMDLCLSKRNSSQEKRILMEKQLDQQEMLIHGLDDQLSHSMVILPKIEQSMSQTAVTQYQQQQQPTFIKSTKALKYKEQQTSRTNKTESNHYQNHERNILKKSSIPLINLHTNSSQQLARGSLSASSVSLNMSATSISLSTASTNANQNASINMNGNSNGKSVLIVKSVAAAPKIQSHIREICAKNIQMNNMDAKKLVSHVSKSFVKVLDLSGNKINGAFVKDINKNNIGKYLKVIKLQNNPIDVPGVSKKIQQLKTQGVTIII